MFPRGTGVNLMLDLDEVLVAESAIPELWLSGIPFGAMQIDQNFLTHEI